jgi:hypothetical protein
VSGTDELIADALRGIAEQAAVPRPMADAAWRAGRRRHRSLMATSAAAVAIAVAAVLLPLTGILGSAQSQRLVPVVQPAVPVHPRPLIQLGQVGRIATRPCRPGSGGVPGPAGGYAYGPTFCFHLTGQRMNITGFRSVRVARSSAKAWVVDIRLKRADAHAFGVLTARLWALASPHNELAFIVRGRVIEAPVVISPITNGSFQIDAGTRTQAQHLLRLLTPDRISRQSRL